MNTNEKLQIPRRKRKGFAGRKREHRAARFHANVAHKIAWHETDPKPESFWLLSDEFRATFPPRVVDISAKELRKAQRAVAQRNIAAVEKNLPVFHF